VRAHRAKPPSRVPPAPGHHAVSGHAAGGGIGGWRGVRERGRVRGSGDRRDLQLGRAVVGRV
jgi:hypothetical protein